MAGNRGKAFETELRNSLKSSGFYVMRIPDSVHWNGHRMMGEPTPADFMAYSPLGDSLKGLMVEAKAVDGKSLPFDRLQPHQFDALSEFDAQHRDMHGYVAVDFYDQRHLRTFNVCYMVPIGMWRDRVEAGERKSLSLAECQDDPRAVECPRTKGSMFDMTAFASAIS